MIRIVSLVFAILALEVHAEIPKKLVGGKSTTIAEVPYQVSLRLQGSHFCGGALVTRRHVVTAAHCVQPVLDLMRHLTIVVGTSSLEKGGQTYTATTLSKHPKYEDNEDTAWMYDIGVITVASDVELSKNVALVNLPTESVKVGEKALASGWGSTSNNETPPSENLQKLTLTIIDFKVCKKAMRSYAAIDDTHICTFVKKGAGTCSGDSGGPLVVNNELIGVVAGGIPCALGYPDIFTNVYKFLRYVNSIIGK